jgi:Domain of unknown function (DUF6898)
MDDDPAGAGGPARRGSPAPEAGEVYLEFGVIGAQMKVTAIDASTGVEVVVFGPTSVSRDELSRLAIRKLQRRLAGPESPPRPRPRDNSRLV